MTITTIRILYILAVFIGGILYGVAIGTYTFTKNGDWILNGNWIIYGMCFIIGTSMLIQGVRHLL